MTKRYREPVDVQLDVADPDRPPVAFTWRGGRYRVLGVLGHWREDAAWWTGGGIEVPQRDLWRVEAQNGTPARGVYELVAEGGGWRLDRVWD
jgi:protein ImuB